MSQQTTVFWERFNQKDFQAAQEQLDSLRSEEKRGVLEELYQKSEFHRRPFTVSVLRRVLHEGESFDDFYKAWHPSREMVNPVEACGQSFQQHFPAPVRVFNGVNIDDSKEIISIGLTWLRSEEEEKQFWSYFDKAIQGGDENNEKRHDSIKKVAEGELLGLFRVESDDNLGTPF